MAMKRETCSQNPNTSKRLRKQDEAKEGDDNQNSMAVEALRPHLPDLVVHKILVLLPTTLAVRMSILSKQWTDVWSRIPVLDFDQHDAYDGNGNLDRVQRRKFVNFLTGCLKFREKDKLLDKFRLHMRYCGGAGSVDKWLNFAVERSVKELDISLRRRPQIEYYCLSGTLLSAKFLTTLSLEHVKIMNITDVIRLPSLKTMSLKNVQFGDSVLSLLISSCPSVEYLSLTSCSFFIGYGIVRVSNCSLQSF